jgi:histidyl-tRNA synthetase
VVNFSGGYMPKETYQSARGVRDILPGEQPYWQFLRETSEMVMNGLGISRIDIPHFENTDIYTKAIGESTDIVGKGMYSLTSRGGDEGKNTYALRPEGTAGVVRAYIQNGMQSWPQPVKLYYMGAMFRYDRPQKGRYREFYQIGLEIFGDASSKADYLSIMSAWQILKKIGLTDIIVYANSIGCPKCRPKYVAKLKKCLKDKGAKLCDDCKVRADKNTLRVFDCKEESCQEAMSDAPIILDALCTECKNHFQSTLELLDYFGIRYDLDPKLVRGLDYYTKTVFEFCEISDKARQNSLGGGGRYDELVSMCGGAKTPAVGFALGMDRIVTLMQEKKVKVPVNGGVEVCILQLGEKAKTASKKIYDILSEQGVNVYFVPSNDALRSQLRLASKLEAKLVVIIGQTEAMKDEAILRDLSASAQENIPVKYLAEEVLKRLQ